MNSGLLGILGQVATCRTLHHRWLGLEQVDGKLVGGLKDGREFSNIKRLDCTLNFEVGRF